MERKSTMKNTMKKMIMLILLALMITVLPAKSWAEEQKAVEPKVAGQKPVEQKPEEDKVSGEVDLSVLSAYIWRGQELTRHSVVLQPAITASYKGFSANIWGNIDTRPYSAGDDKYAPNHTETDVTIFYSRAFGIVQAGAGYIYYGLAAATPGGADLLDAQEIFVTLGLNTILTPTLTVYREIDHYHQWYATLGISHTFALHEKVGLKLAATASYLLSTDETTYAKYDSDSLATTDKFNNFHDGIVTVSLPLAVYKSLSVTPTVSYVFPLSNDARYEMRARNLQTGAAPSERDSAYIYGGVTFIYAF